VSKASRRLARVLVMVHVSLERVKLRTSNLAGIFTPKIRVEERELDSQLCATATAIVDSPLRYSDRYVVAINRPNIKVSIRTACGSNKRKAIIKMFNP